MLPNITFENLFTYSPMSVDIVAHVLTLGYAVMLAALFYFILTLKTVSPKYRISSVLSVVVMTSAFLLLYKQSQNWTDAFAFDAATATYVRAAGADTFTNGYRYLNWLIDVPMLLFQVLFVVNLGSDRFASVRNQFFASGSLMILTGYVGQYYEVSSLPLFLFWGTVSTVFFVHVLWLMRGILKDGQHGMTPRAARRMDQIWWLFLASWMLYPGAYLMPLFTAMPDGVGTGALPFLSGEAGVVGRQITYTVADIASKVIYGVLLTLAAQARSEDEDGYVYDRLLPTGDRPSAV